MKIDSTFQCTNPDLLTTWMDWAVIVQLYDHMVSFNVIKEGELLSPGDWMQKLSFYTSELGKGFDRAALEHQHKPKTIQPQEHCS